MDHAARVVLTASDQTRAAFTSMTSSLASAGTALTGFLGQAQGFASQLVTGKLLEWGKASVEAADNVHKLSQRTGVAVETLSGYQYAAKIAGVSGDDLEKGFKKLNGEIENAARGNVQASAEFAALGISVRDSSGKTKDAGVVMNELADKFADMPDGAQKAAMAVNFFGKSGDRMIPMLNEGSAGLKKLTDEAARFGVVISAKTAKQAEEFSDQVTKIGFVSEGLKMSFTSAALPIMKSFADQLLDAKTAAGGLTEKIKSFATTDNLLNWAETGAEVVAIIADKLMLAKAGFDTLGLSLAHLAAQGVNTFELLTGKKTYDEWLAAGRAIGEGFKKDMEEAWDPKRFTQFQDAVSETFARVREDIAKGNTEAVVQTKKKVGAMATELNAGQKKLAEQFEADQAKAMLSAKDFAILQTKKKYDEMLKTAQGNAELTSKINKKLMAELDAIDQGHFEARSALIGKTVSAAATAAESIVGIESGAAAAIISEQDRIAQAKRAAAMADVMAAATLKAGTGTFGQGISSPTGSFGQWARERLAEYATRYGTGSDTFKDELDKARTDFGPSVVPSNLAGFAEGGSFVVGGRPGTDANMVMFKATQGERVTISTPQQSAGGGVVNNYTYNISCPDGVRLLEIIRHTLRGDPAGFDTFKRKG